MCIYNYNVVIRHMRTENEPYSWNSTENCITDLFLNNSMFTQNWLVTSFSVCWAVVQYIGTLCKQDLFTRVQQLQIQMHYVVEINIPTIQTTGLSFDFPIVTLFPCQNTQTPFLSNRVITRNWYHWSFLSYKSRTGRIFLLTSGNALFHKLEVWEWHSFASYYPIAFYPTTGYITGPTCRSFHEWVQSLT